MLVGHSWGGFLWLGGQGFLQESNATEDVLISKGNITFHILPELHYISHQKAWLALSRQIGFFHPKLEGFGIGHHLLLLQLPDVLAVTWNQVVAGNSSNEGTAVLVGPDGNSQHGAIC